MRSPFDDEGVELLTIEVVQKEAARSLVDLTRRVPTW